MNIVFGAENMIMNGKVNRFPSPRETRALIQVAWEAGPDLQAFLGFVTAYARGRFSSSTAEKVALASNELLDNAVRYSSLSRDISYALQTLDTYVCVSVTNATVRTRIEMLTDQLKRLEASPESVYTAEFERSVTGNGRRSMLGLARIRHETGMTLEATAEANVVTVRAMGHR